jgi:hypothetical protein
MYLVVVLAVASWCGATIIVDDFESYADSAALNAKLVGQTPNETVTLSAAGHNGGQALQAAYNTWADPWWSGTQLTFGGANGQDWAGQTTLTVWYKVLTAASTIEIKLSDCWGDMFNVAYKAAASPTPVGDWVKWDIDITNLVNYAGAGSWMINHVGRIQLAQVVPNNGGGTVLYDDISVPEPVTLTLLSLGGLLLRKRK